MKHMNKVLIAIALVALIALTTLEFAPVTYAAQMTISANPGALASAGDVRIDITITNTSNVNMESISVTTSEGTYNMSGTTIHPGETSNLTIASYYVSEERIGVSIPFMVSWTESGEFKSEALYLTIDRLETQPPSQTATPTDNPVPNTQAPDVELLTFDYSVDRRQSEQGGKIVFTYLLTNISGYEVTGVTLTDPSIFGSTALLSNVSIAPGETRTETYIYTMGESTVTASPVVTYNGLSGTRTINGEQLTLERVTVSMDVSVNMGETTLTGTEFSILVANNGNKPISGLTITDNTGVNVVQSTTIGVGESQTFSHTVQTDTTREVYFILSGSLATGENYSYETEKYQIWAYVDPALVTVDFIIEVLEFIDENGYVTLKFTATNTGVVDLLNLSISEERVGVIGELDDIAQGASASASFTVHAGASRDLNFTLTGYDPNGRPWTFNTVLLAESCGGLVNPTGSIRGNINVGATISDVLADILIVLAVIAGVSGVALVVLAILEKRAIKLSPSGNGGASRKNERKS